MTHEPTPRTTGTPAGPEDDDTLPDADSIPTHEHARDRQRTPDGELDD